jgi:alpha/beta superfamily hydrolase
MSRQLEPVRLEGPAGALEAQYTHPARARPGAALVCHPHPQHGGTMHTKAVYHIARGMESAGLPVLRFNFRGVGRSAGGYTGGPGERDDARAALAWLAARHPTGPLFVGGFSFGSWIGLEVGGADPRVSALVGVGLPLELYDFGFLHRSAQPLLGVVGERDAFCPVAAFRALMHSLGPRAEAVVLSGAEHLLTTALQPLEAAVARFTSARLAALGGL